MTEVPPGGVKVTARMAPVGLSRRKTQHTWSRRARQIKRSNNVLGVTSATTRTRRSSGDSKRRVDPHMFELFRSPGCLIAAALCLQRGVRCRIATLASPRLSRWA